MAFFLKYKKHYIQICIHVKLREKKTLKLKKIIVEMRIWCSKSGNAKLIAKTTKNNGLLHGIGFAHFVRSYGDL